MKAYVSLDLPDGEDGRFIVLNDVNDDTFNQAIRRVYKTTIIENFMNTYGILNWDSEQEQTDVTLTSEQCHRLVNEEHEDGGTLIVSIILDNGILIYSNGG